MPLTGNGFPTGVPPRPTGPATERVLVPEHVTDDVANVLGRVTIAALLGWALAAVEFLALLYCTGGFH